MTNNNQGSGVRVLAALDELIGTNLVGGEPQEQTYRGYNIRYDPPPIPIRTCDWQFEHEDYDGAPMNFGEGPADHRSGFGPSAAACREMIDEMIADEEEESAPYEPATHNDTADDCWLDDLSPAAEREDE